MYTIRPFELTDHDYEAMVAINNAAWPDEPTTVAHAKHHDEQRNPKYLHQRFVVEADDGRIVAEGGCWESPWSYVPGKYGVNFQIYPDWENKGVEAQLYDHIIAFLNEQTLKPTILDTYTREDKAARMQFWADRGFEIAQRENSSDVDLQDYDYAPFAGVEEKVLAQGIELLTLPELQARDDDWMQKYYDLDIEASRDIPNPDPITPEPIEEFAKMFKNPNFISEAHFFAVDDGKWVGLSSLWKDDVRTDRLWVGFTGVLRSHRRRGIALAMKLRTLRFAQTYGARYIETENEENNPMYTINVKVGFKPKPRWLSYRKKMVGEAKDKR